VLASGANETNASLNATRHAELVAIDRVLLPSAGGGGRGAAAAAAAAAATLRRCELYVTVEPCIMCAAALAEVRIGRVFFGCGNDRFGGCGSVLRLHESGALPPPPACGAYPCTGGVLADEGVAMLRRFYSRGNAKIAKPQRRVSRQPPATAAAATANAAQSAAAAAATPQLGRDG
jgi:tRNA-specific adenosine deaminase 2